MQEQYRRVILLMAICIFLMFLPLGISNTRSPFGVQNVEIISLLYTYSLFESESLFIWHITPMVLGLTIIQVLPCLYFWLRIDVGDLRHVYARAAACITLTTTISFLFFESIIWTIGSNTSAAFVMFPTLCVAILIVFPLVKKIAKTFEMLDALENQERWIEQVPRWWNIRVKRLAYVLGILFILLPIGIPITTYGERILVIGIYDNPLLFQTPLLWFQIAPRFNTFFVIIPPLHYQIVTLLCSIFHFIFLIAIFEYYRGTVFIRNVITKGIFGVIWSFLVYEGYFLFSNLATVNLFLPVPAFTIIGLVSLSLRGKVPLELKDWLGSLATSHEYAEETIVKVPLTYILTSRLKKKDQGDSESTKTFS